MLYDIGYPDGTTPEMLRSAGIEGEQEDENDIFDIYFDDMLALDKTQATNILAPAVLCLGKNCEISVPIEDGRGTFHKKTITVSTEHLQTIVDNLREYADGLENMIYNH